MRGDLVVELDGWARFDTAEKVADAADDVGVIGVVVKATQGSWWRNVETLPTLNTVELQGLVTGVLHYAEPWHGDTFDESANLLAAVAHRDLPLGLWIEVTDLGDRTPQDAAEWVHELLDSCHTDSRPVVLVTTQTLHDTLTGAPWGHRVVLRGDDALARTTWWAVEDAGLAPPAFYPVSAVYRLSTTRGLNPAGSGAPAEAATGRAALALVDETTAPGAEDRTDDPGDHEGTSGEPDDDDDAHGTADDDDAGAHPDEATGSHGVGADEPVTV